MDKIGNGRISLRREFYSHQWMEAEFGDDSHPQYKHPIPSDSQLNIQGSFHFYESFHGKFKMLSFELMTNFVSADLAGDQQMGFTSQSVDDHRIFFQFLVPLFPTRFHPEAVVKLHYLETASGQKFTSYFKCKIGHVKRMQITDSTQRECDFAIINPHASAYRSSGQAAMPQGPNYHQVPESGKTSLPVPETSPQNAPVSENKKTCPSCGSENAAGSYFCNICGTSLKTGASQSAPISQKAGQSVQNRAAQARPVPQADPPFHSAADDLAGAQEKSQEQRKGCGQVGFGVLTLIGAMFLLLASFMYWSESGVAILFTVNTSFGMIAGITATFGKRKSGVGLCIIFWVLAVLILLLFVVVSG